MKFAFLKSAVATLAIAASAVTANAEDWAPNGPIKMMVAFQAGGGVDTMARLLCQRTKRRNGWEFIPENVAGKGGATMATASRTSRQMV